MNPGDSAKYYKLSISPFFLQLLLFCSVFIIYRNVIIQQTLLPQDMALFSRNDTTLKSLSFSLLALPINYFFKANSPLSMKRERSNRIMLHRSARVALQHCSILINGGQLALILLYSFFFNMLSVSLLILL